VQLVEAIALEGLADHAARVADHERHLLGGHRLGRTDQVAFVLAIFVVDHDHELTAGDRGNGVFDGSERHGDHDSFASWCSTAWATYFASTSTSRLTGAPTGLTPSVVTAWVCGMSAIVKCSGVVSTTVRLTPSTVIEPFSTVPFVTVGGASTRSVI